MTLHSSLVEYFLYSPVVEYWENVVFICALVLVGAILLIGIIASFVDWIDPRY